MIKKVKRVALLAASLISLNAFAAESGPDDCAKIKTYEVVSTQNPVNDYQHIILKRNACNELSYLGEEYVSLCEKSMDLRREAGVKLKNDRSACLDGGKSKYCIALGFKNSSPVTYYFLVAVSKMNTGKNNVACLHSPILQQTVVQ